MPLNKLNQFEDDLFTEIVAWDMNGLNDAAELIKSFCSALKRHMKHTGTTHPESGEDVYCVSAEMADFLAGGA